MGVDAWINVYAFQFDITSFSTPTVTFATEFDAGYFLSADANGIPMAISFPSQTQGSYTVMLTPIPAPGQAAALAMVGLLAVAQRKRR